MTVPEQEEGGEGWLRELCLLVRTGIQSAELPFSLYIPSKDKEMIEIFPLFSSHVS